MADTEKPMAQAYLVITSWPDLEQAKRQARGWVEKKLAASVNVLPLMDSIYTWQGELRSGKEHKMFIKTSANRLEALQRDATMSQGDLAEIAGMSRSSVWRRIRDLEESGLIQRQVALLDPKQVGIALQVLLAVAMTEHTDKNRHDFEGFVNTLPEVTECYSVSGERDYVLHVATPDMDTYTHFLNQQILKHPAVRSASSTFVLKRVKYITQLPLVS